jgi:D-alanyl-D-alanine carboxypeptidase/D-alanyl-D-alanine-endopeptidase (penicillin-binding protein 4)
LSESNGRFGYWKDAAKGALIGAGVLALIIGGFSISGANLPTSSGSNTPDASSTTSSMPSPSSTSNRTCSVATQATDAALGNFSGVVINAKTDEVLFDRNASVPAATASTLKTLTAAAALLTLGPNYRVETRVYQDAANPGTIILVGAGDPTLSRTAIGKQSVYRDEPKLSTLALNVNKKMGATPITNIMLDSTLFAGPTWEPSWERSEQTQGYMSEVTALQVDGDRLNPAAETSQRTTTPVQNAGKWFKQALGASAATASITVGAMPAGATQLASVSSQPISKWITHMMQVSDNTEAEYLARLVSLDLGFDGSFSSLNAAIKKALKPTNLDSTGVVIKDGSGLSDFNAVSPSFMAQLYKLVYEGQGIFSTIKQSLPVAGESGSLASRFKGDNLDATGHIYAKTGWIKHGYTLAGIIEAKDGTSMVFAVYALGNVTDAAKTAIDNLVTGFYRCGATLSNE